MCWKKKKRTDKYAAAATSKSLHDAYERYGETKKREAIERPAREREQQEREDKFRENKEREAKEKRRLELDPPQQKPSVGDCHSKTELLTLSATQSTSVVPKRGVVHAPADDAEVHTAHEVEVGSTCLSALGSD